MSTSGPIVVSAVTEDASGAAIDTAVYSNIWPPYNVVQNPFYIQGVSIIPSTYSRGATPATITFTQITNRDLPIGGLLKISTSVQLFIGSGDPTCTGGVGDIEGKNGRQSNIPYTLELSSNQIIPAGLITFECSCPFADTSMSPNPPAGQVPIIGTVVMLSEGLGGNAIDGLTVYEGAPFVSVEPYIIATSFIPSTYVKDETLTWIRFSQTIVTPLQVDERFQIATSETLLGNLALGGVLRCNATVSPPGFNGHFYVSTPSGSSITVIVKAAMLPAGTLVLECRGSALIAPVLSSLAPTPYLITATVFTESPFGVAIDMMRMYGWPPYHVTAVPTIVGGPIVLSDTRATVTPSTITFTMVLASALALGDKIVIRPDVPLFSAGPCTCSEGTRALAAVAVHDNPQLVVTVAVAYSGNSVLKIQCSGSSILPCGSAGVSFPVTVGTISGADGSVIDADVLFSNSVGFTSPTFASAHQFVPDPVNYRRGEKPMAIRFTQTLSTQLTAEDQMEIESSVELFDDQSQPMCTCVHESGTGSVLAYTITTNAIRISGSAGRLTITLTEGVIEPGLEIKLVCISNITENGVPGTIVTASVLTRNRDSGRMIDLADSFAGLPYKFTGMIAGAIIPSTYAEGEIPTVITFTQTTTTKMYNGHYLVITTSQPLFNLAGMVSCTGAIPEVAQPAPLVGQHTIVAPLTGTGASGRLKISANQVVYPGLSSISCTGLGSITLVPNPPAGHLVTGNVITGYWHDTTCYECGEFEEIDKGDVYGAPLYRTVVQPPPAQDKVLAVRNMVAADYVDVELVGDFGAGFPTILHFECTNLEAHNMPFVKFIRGDPPMMLPCTQGDPSADDYVERLQFISLTSGALVLTVNFPPNPNFDDEASTWSRYYQICFKPNIAASYQRLKGYEGNAAYAGMSEFITVSARHHHLLYTDAADLATHTCVHITSIAIDSTVVRIPQNAFDDCKNVALVTFAHATKLRSIGQHAFTGLKIVSLFLNQCDHLRSIGANAFEHCKFLTKVTMPPQLESLGHSAFVGTSLHDYSQVNWNGVDCVVVANNGSAAWRRQRILQASPPNITPNIFPGWQCPLPAQNKTYCDEGYGGSSCDFCLPRWHRAHGVCVKCVYTSFIDAFALPTAVNVGGVLLFLPILLVCKVIYVLQCSAAQCALLFCRWVQMHLYSTLTPLSPSLSMQCRCSLLLFI